MRRLYHAIRQHPQIVKRPGLAQFIKFSLVGASNTVIDFGTYLFFTRLLALHYLPANTLSFTLAATWSYTMNRLWTFRDRSSRIRVQYFKFLFVSLIGLGLVSLLLFFFVEVLGFHDLVAKALAVVIVLVWNFSANRYWTFRPPRLA